MLLEAIKHKRGPSTDGGPRWDEHQVTPPSHRITQQALSVEESRSKARSIRDMIGELREKKRLSEGRSEGPKRAKGLEVGKTRYRGCDAHETARRKAEAQEWLRRENARERAEEIRRSLADDPSAAEALRKSDADLIAWYEAQCAMLALEIEELEQAEVPR